MSRAAGWDIVPPTVLRDGPFGPGMCQLWIDCDPDVDVIAMSRRADHAALRQMAVFDAVVNNADRKIGHLLPAPGGHLYGCDHGVCFAEEYKLRTVLWQWRGEPPARAGHRRRCAAWKPPWTTSARHGAAPSWLDPGGDHGHRRAGGTAARAPGASLPAGGLAGRALASRLTGSGCGRAG